MPTETPLEKFTLKVGAEIDRKVSDATNGQYGEPVPTAAEMATALHAKADEVASG